MIECISLSTSAGSFYAHHYPGRSGHLLVFIPGLMESKAGLFYIWSRMAHKFHCMDHSCLLFDLAGQGDNLLPLSFDIWSEQKKAIFDYFFNHRIHLLARGLGAIFLTPGYFNYAINPSLFDPIAEQLKSIRWTLSPFNSDFLTPAAPHSLIDIEKECFHRLGAEAECIGGLQLPKAFVEQLSLKLPSFLPKNTIYYDDGTGHLLFDKQSERNFLMDRIAVDLQAKIYESSDY